MVGFSQWPLVAGGMGIVIGFVVAWGMFSSNPRVQPVQTAPAANLAHEQTAGPVPVSKTDPIPSREETQPEPQPPANTEPQVAAKSVPQQPKGFPLLPQGVTADAAGDPEVYKRLPGVPQPIINRDGRDMTAEVMSMIQVRHEPQPFPGTANSQQTPVKAMEFPKTQEETDRMVQELNRRAQEANSQAQQGASPPQ